MEHSFIYYQVHISNTCLNLVSPRSTWQAVDMPFWSGWEEHQSISLQVEKIQVEKKAELASLFDLETKETPYSAMQTRREWLHTLGKLPVSAPELEQQLAHTLSGRSLLLQEMKAKLNKTNLLATLQKLYLQGFFDWHSSIGWKNNQAYCRRCGYAQDKGEGSLISLYKKLFIAEERLIKVDCQSCGKADCYYCPRCLQLGRAKACEPLLQWSRIEEVAAATSIAASHPSTAQTTMVQTTIARPRKEVVFSWDGELSPAQQAASERLLQFVHSTEHRVPARQYNRQNTNKEFLIWAVCGAGKTEIVYQTIYQALLHGQKVLLTSPRRDVILELSPRLKAVFPCTTIRTLYAESKEKYEPGELFVATTHQTLRFQNFFDLLIIDEEDAFPYHHDPMLPYAVHRAKKDTAAVVYVTATPRPAMIRQLQQKKLEYVLIPQRYHGEPLAVPVIQPIGEWRKAMKKKILITQLVQYVLHLIQHRRFGYLFVPHVRDLKLVQGYLDETILPYLRKKEKDIPEPFVIEGVHAEHPDRTAIVQRFREQRIHVLITTTILERGVTIAYSDVAILGSDDPVFGTAALIQMAGRVGRKFEDPQGNVWFFPQARTAAQYQCIQQIKSWNKEAFSNKQSLRQQGGGRQ